MDVEQTLKRADALEKPGCCLATKPTRRMPSPRRGYAPWSFPTAPTASGSSMKRAIPLRHQREPALDLFPLRLDMGMQFRP